MKYILHFSFKVKIRQIYHNACKIVPLMLFKIYQITSNTKLIVKIYCLHFSIFAFFIHHIYFSILFLVKNSL